jgi:4-hydroxyacetophenone monooxygenase
VDREPGTDDPTLLDKVIPDYPATGKRTLQDNGSWLQTLTRDNVDLVRTPIDHIESDAVITADGVRHQADVLVYATGFRVNDMVSSLKVFGRNGINLHEQWGNRPAAYLGITVPASPTSSCSTVRAPTSPAAAA